MSWIKDGRSRTTFDRYKTYEHERVQKRLDSVIPAVNSKVMQALEVNSALCLVYKRLKFGVTCSCRGVEHFEQEDHGFGIADGSSLGKLHGTNLGGMFGGMSAAVSLDDVGAGTANVLDNADILAGGMDVDYREDGLGTVNCGVCYRTGVLPALSAVGRLYNVCAHPHVVEQSGYTLDQTVKPAQFNRVRDDGYVDFDHFIPLYFKGGEFSVRDNERVLKAFPRPEIVVGDSVLPLTIANMQKYKGKHVKIRVRGHETFTHLVLVFDQGLPPIKGNLSEEANILSYDEELTVGNLTVVLPYTVGQLNPQDMIVVPFKNYVLKIIDANKKRTAKNEQWEWVCVCRAVQRKEVDFNLNKGYQIT